MRAPLNTLSQWSYDSWNERVCVAKVSNFRPISGT